MRPRANRMHPRVAQGRDCSTVQGPRHTPRPSVQTAPRLRDQFAESGRITDRQVRQHLPVYLEPGPLQAVHEPRVAHVVLTGRSVDPHDPEPTELTLPLLTVTVRVLPPPLDRV